MKYLILKRVAYRRGYIQGYLFLGGEYVCDTLEPPLEPIGPTHQLCHAAAIPSGVYKVKVKRGGLSVVGIPHLRNRQIHTGTRIKDLRGGILVGRNAPVGLLTDSPQTFAQLKERITQLLKTQPTVFIHIWNG